MKNILTLFEGIDGTGKSTVGRLFAQKKVAAFIDTPIEPYVSSRRMIGESASLLAQFHFYLSSNLYLSAEFPKFLLSQDVVCVRYFYSTFIDYSIRFGMSTEQLFSKVGLSPDDFSKPDRTFMLYSSPEVQKHRIEARNNGLHTHTDKLVMADSSYRNEISRRYLDIASKNGWHVIDTSEKSIDQVVEECLRINNR